MENETYKIVSVYHKHIDCQPHVDCCSRRNIHGLNLKYLHAYGLRSRCDFIIDFQMWLNNFHIKQIYAHDPLKERVLLQTNLITDICLPDWKMRANTPYHLVALRFKQMSVPILDKSCNFYIHNAYNADPIRKMTETQRLKRLHGHHCSLYDTYELYLYHLFETSSL